MVVPEPQNGSSTVSPTNENGTRESGAALRARFDRRLRSGDPGVQGSGVWRFRELLLPGRGEVVTHPEGHTPLYRRESLSAFAGIDDLALKHEGENPTGSFKDRGMTVAVSQALRAGATAVACASTGNTSASMAAYAAQAGLPALVFVPAGKVAAGKLAQALAYGARTLLVRGDFDACLRLVREASDALGIALLNSINPWRIEGQKTIVLELLQQRGWEPPDWIVVPAGNLGNTSAFGKALREARELGLVRRLPRVAAVQAAGASPFFRSFRAGFQRHPHPPRAVSPQADQPPGFPFAMRNWSVHLKSGAFTREKDGLYAVSAENIPSFREEPDMPPEAAVRAWMLVFYAPDTTEPPAKYWQTVGKAYFEGYRDSIKLDDEMRAAAAEAVKDAPGDEERLQKLLDYATRGFKKARPGTPPPDTRQKDKENRNTLDTWRRQTGTGWDTRAT